MESMKKSGKNNQRLLLFVLLCSFWTCKESPELIPPKIVTMTAEETQTLAETLKEQTNLEIAPGLQLELWAGDSLAPDPITLSIDDFGQVYLTRTNRQKNSEFDIRGYQHWMTPSISLQSVEDRRAFLRETFAPEKSDENSWFPDLNKDGSHDWRDLKVEQDEVWRVADTNGDGLADQATRIVRDFHEEITDVAGALLVRRHDMFVGIGPDMWRLEDPDGDGIPEKKTSISHGYAVHIGFGAHGMSGAIEGPDGKIYWGIGDIGANIVDQEGKHHMYPNQGVIVRCNPDGSDFEVYAHGLRNTHEFVFDAFGNLISADNDGDHPGESERLVHIVEGSDAGWRANWQYGKYTDPRNNAYKVWMDEELYKPHWEGQAAHIIPPIMNYHNGPTGMVFNPGTALGEAWLNKFFLVEFVGNPSRSPLWSFSLKPKGASFELQEEQKIVTGILPTGIRFGPDGALYIADWVQGWGTKDYGRIWRLDVTADHNDLDAIRQETEILMKLDYTTQKRDELANLLHHADMRIRQKAQFELAARGEEGAVVFNGAISQTEHRMGRIHGIWGLGQLAHHDLARAADLLSLLEDDDPEIVAQTAKTLGDVRYGNSAPQLVPLLKHEHPRVRFFAAQALGRLAYKPAVPALLDLLQNNNDEDLYLRHAGILALARIGEAAPILALENHSSKALRTAAVVVLRKWQDPRVARFLDDPDEYIVTEAARAINDDWSIEEALPDLAELLTDSRFQEEALLRRAINAALRAGGEEQLEHLITFASRPLVRSELRAEALATLATWAQPSVLDRVDGRYRGEIIRDPQPVRQKLSPIVSTFLQDQPAEVLIAASQLITELEIEGHEETLARIFESNENPSVRSAMLEALADFRKEDLNSVIQLGMEDEDEEVRTTALGMLKDVDVDADRLPAIANPIFSKGSVREQQQMLSVLRDMDVNKTLPLLTELVERMDKGDLPKALMLDLREAVDSTHSTALIARADAWSEGERLVEQYSETLYGGNARRGYRYFRSNAAGQCSRCHAIGDETADVGPNLRNIGNQLTREQLLEALVEPSARIAPGYGVVMLTLTDDQVVSGTLLEEHDDHLLLKTSQAEPLEIPVERIAKREHQYSSMPPMAVIMDRRDIRDVIEFLANLKEESL